MVLGSGDRSSTWPTLFVEAAAHVTVVCSILVC
jgi:hypothetical protein